METALPASTYDESEVARRGPWIQAARRFRRQKLAVVAPGLLLLIFISRPSAKAFSWIISLQWRRFFPPNAI
jgi:hypothetical protein